MQSRLHAAIGSKLTHQLVHRPNDANKSIKKIRHSPIFANRYNIQNWISKFRILNVEILKNGQKNYKISTSLANFRKSHFTQSLSLKLENVNGNLQCERPKIRHPAAQPSNYQLNFRPPKWMVSRGEIQKRTAHAAHTLPTGREWGGGDLWPLSPPPTEQKRCRKI